MKISEGSVGVASKSIIKPKISSAKNAEGIMSNINLGDISHLNIKINESSDRSQNFDFDYASMFDSNVSVDDIRQYGIGEDTRSIYKEIDEKGGNAGYFKTIDNRFKDASEKYDLIANKIKETFGDDKEAYDFEMRSLNKAFENENAISIMLQKRKSFIGINSDIGKQSSELAKKITDKFVEMYKNGGKVGSDGLSLQNIFKSVLPEKSTSLNNISYKDYQIINEARENSYGKTGMDVLKSLSENEDLSDVLRNEYKRLYNSNNIYGLTFNKTV